MKSVKIFFSTLRRNLVPTHGATDNAFRDGVHVFINTGMSLLFYCITIFLREGKRKNVQVYHTEYTTEVVITVSWTEQNESTSMSVTFTEVFLFLKKNLNASKPSEHSPLGSLACISLYCRWAST